MRSHDKWLCFKPLNVTLDSPTPSILLPSPAHPTRPLTHPPTSPITHPFNVLQTIPFVTGSIALGSCILEPLPDLGILLWARRQGLQELFPTELAFAIQLDLRIGFVLCESRRCQGDLCFLRGRMLWVIMGLSTTSCFLCMGSCGNMLYNIMIVYLYYIILCIGA